MGWVVGTLGTTMVAMGTKTKQTKWFGIAVRWGLTQSCWGWRVQHRYGGCRRREKEKIKRTKIKTKIKTKTKATKKAILFCTVLGWLEGIPSNV
tara:strand:- start:547 stop:828 length:282 start_codon:yes stop_codon:yes gene_type:complete